MVRFKILWGVAALTVFGFLMTSLFVNQDLPIFQDDSIKTKLTEDIEEKLLAAYNDTLQYGADTTDVLDPCKMRDSFGDMEGLSKCGESIMNIDCSGNAKCFVGTVDRIIDGDTIIVNDIHVRFALAAAPELSENGGQEAKELIESTCPVGSRALVDEDDRQTAGSYGRIIAKLYCNNVSLNEVLVSKGLGKIDSRFCTKSEFASESWAKEHGC